MKTSITEKDGKMIATLEGSLDSAAAEKVANELAPLHESKGQAIIIDCSGLSYICSSGLRIFLGIRKHAAITGASVTLTGVSDNIRDIFFATGFHNLFTIECASNTL